MTQFEEKDKCCSCRKCKQHWGGEHSRNNAGECCKMTDWKRILEKRDYWKDVKCTWCGKMMI